MPNSFAAARTESFRRITRLVNRWQVRVVSLIGGEGKESNLPSPTRRDKPVLKYGVRGVGRCPRVPGSLVLSGDRSGLVPLDAG